MNVGKNLSAIRKQHGMTQQELAEKLDVSRQAVSRWEQNVSEPSTENLIRLGTLFGVSVDFLIGNERQESSAANHEQRRDLVRKKFSIFNRHIYLVLALIVFLYELVCIATYTSPNSPLFLKSVFVTRAIGPVFSFFIATYLSLTVLHYTDKWKKVPEALRLLSAFLVAAAWIGLCHLLRGYTPLFWRSYYAAPIAAVYSIVLYLLKSRKGETI